MVELILHASHWNFREMLAPVVLGVEDNRLSHSWECDQMFLLIFLDMKCGDDSNVAHTSQAVTLYIIYSVPLPIPHFLLNSAPRQVN